MRRSLYIYVSRSLMPPMMNAFDQCDTTLPCAQRDVTTAPAQALAMLNNVFVHERSEAMATRILSMSDSADQHITTAWTLALGRTPSEEERALAERHIAVQQQRFAALDGTDTKSDPPTGLSAAAHQETSSAELALTSLCHVLLNSNEFLYLD